MSTRTEPARAATWPTRWALGVALGLAVALPVQAQRGVYTQSPQSVQQEIARAMRNPVVLERSMIDKYPSSMDHEHRAMLLDYITRRMQDDRVLGVITRTVTPLIQARATPPQMVRQVQEAMVALQIRGISRLPDDRAEQFLRMSIDMSESVSADQCKKLMLSQLDTPAMLELERQYQARLPLPRLRQMLDLYQFALEAELHEAPPRRGRAALDAPAQTALQKLVARRMTVFAPGVADRTLSRPEEASAKDVCAVFAEVSRAGLELPGPMRTQFLEYMLAQISK